jgi:hypothetical protein
MSGEERAMRFADWRCLYCGGFNYRATECAARKKAQTFKSAEQRSSMEETRKVPKNREKIRSTQARWRFG